MVMPIRDLKPDGAAGADTVGGRRPTAVSAPAAAAPELSAQHLGHFFRKLGITLRQVVTDLVRLHFLRIEDLAQRALRQVRQARVPFGGTVLASVAGEQPCGPQFMRITQFLRLPARKRCQPAVSYTHLTLP